MVESTIASVNVNPLSQDIEAQVVAQLVAKKDVKFNFRTTDIPDESKVGQVDEKTGKQPTKEWKRPTLTMSIPHVTPAGIIAAMQAGDKTTELICDAVNDVIINRQRGLIGEKIEADPTVNLTPDLFDLQLLNLVAIANLPKSERGAGIAKEAWAAFVKDYKETMVTPEAVAMFPDQKPRSAEVLEKHGILLAGKFNQIRARKDIVTQMLGFLDIWVECSKNAEEHQACYELLRNKGDAILKGEEFNDL
jgi:hypothetical protein